MGEYFISITLASLTSRYFMKLVILVVLLPFFLIAQNNPIELGDVHWLRSFEEAQVKSKKEGKSLG